MTTARNFPSDEADKFVVRLPSGMRDKISDAAREAGRSMNAEVVHRLQTSFTPAIATSNAKFSGLDGTGDDVFDLVNDFATKRGMSYRDALLLLVTAGLQPEAPQIVHIRVGAGATMKEVKAIVAEAAAIADPQASVIYESDSSAGASGDK